MFNIAEEEYNFEHHDPPMSMILTENGNSLYLGNLSDS
jgi:hypothetical protein